MARRRWNGWISLAGTLASAVASVSPNTKVGVSFDADPFGHYQNSYWPMAEGIDHIPGVGFIGFDIYTEQGFTNMQTFLQQQDRVDRRSLVYA